MAFGSAKVAASFQQHVQRDAMRFYEADAKGNSDHKLDFKEFLVMQPPAIKKSHTEAEIRGWFDAADTDGDGAVSINEFFVWTLQKEALNGMDGLRSLFECYDKDGTGCIDMHEFQRICDDLGFGGAAHEIFMDLDEDTNWPGKAWRRSGGHCCDLHKEQGAKIRRAGEAVLCGE